MSDARRPVSIFRLQQATKTLSRRAWRASRRARGGSQPKRQPVDRLQLATAVLMAMGLRPRDAMAR